MQISVPVPTGRPGLLRERSGAAAVELALLAPVMILILAGLVDAGRLATRRMQVRAAAQAGADYVLKKGWDQAAVQAAVTSATSLPVTATPAPTVSTGCVTGLSIVAAAGATCPSGTSTGQFAVIRAQTSFTPVMPWPGLSSPTVLDARALVRVQ